MESWKLNNERIGFKNLSFFLLSMHDIQLTMNRWNIQFNFSFIMFLSSWLPFEFGDLYLLQVLLTPTHLAIVMEYAAGGELFARICSAGRFNENEVKEYSSCFEKRVRLCRFLYAYIYIYICIFCRFICAKRWEIVLWEFGKVTWTELPYQLIVLFSCFRGHSFFHPFALTIDPYRSFKIVTSVTPAELITQFLPHFSCSFNKISSLLS